MKKIVCSFIVVVIAASSFAQKVIVNDANAEVRPVSKSFSSIKISGGIDLYLSQFDEESIAVSASKEEHRASIITEVSNGVLNIYSNNQNWNGSNKKMKAYVSFKKLEKLQASGASDVQVAGAIEGSTLEMNFSGASDFKGAVKVTELKIVLSGASDAKISGDAMNVNISSSGASDVSGYDLNTETCTVRASGASDVHIKVNKELNAHASGASSIFYKGAAVIKKMESTGASSVSKKEG
jgi:hypothetical protein